jgi:hypothetical protein
MSSLYNSARPHAKSNCLVVKEVSQDEMASLSKETKVKRVRWGVMDLQDETARLLDLLDPKVIVERQESCLF